MDDNKEINKADKEMAKFNCEGRHEPAISSSSSPARWQSQSPSPSPSPPYKHTHIKSIGQTPRLDTSDNLKADLELLCGLQTPATFLSFPPAASFRLAPDALGRLEQLLAHVRVARFSYDFVTESAHVMMVESTIHNQCNRAIGSLLESAIQQLADAVTAAAAGTAAAHRPLSRQVNDTGDENHGEHQRRHEVEQNGLLDTLSRRLRQVWCDNAVTIAVPNKLRKDPDNQFVDSMAPSPIPPFIVEICYSQTFKDAQNKAEKYVKHTDGQIRTVLILDIQRPEISSMRIYLFATDMAAGGRPVPREVQRLTLFDFADASAAAEHSPLRLFASDFLSADANVPARLNRPIPFESHGDETVLVEIPFESLRDACLRARELHIKKQEKARSFRPL